MRNRWLVSIAFVLLIAGLAVFLYWFFIGRFYVSTEDAYVNGNQVYLTPQVAGGVRAIFADNTNLVVQGQTVVALDETDQQIRVEELKASLAETVRQVANLFQIVEAKKAEVELRSAELRQSELDLEHRIGLSDSGAISVEEYEQYQTNAAVSRSQKEFAEKELAAARQLVDGTTVETHPLVQEAAWELRKAYLDLIRCQIWAPVTGFVAKRNVQVGDRVSIGDPLLFIVPLDQIWIWANFKETKIHRLRMGQPVEFTADMYGSMVKFHGKVVGLQPGSGNAFALLPPENASGNWIKIIQRVPVRVSIDPEELKAHPLVIGLSMHVHVDIHDTSGPRLTEMPTCAPIYTTAIYRRQVEQMEQIEPLIREMIKENYFFYNDSIPIPLQELDLGNAKAPAIE